MRSLRLARHLQQLGSETYFETIDEDDDKFGCCLSEFFAAIKSGIFDYLVVDLKPGTLAWRALEKQVAELKCKVVQIVDDPEDAWLGCSVLDQNFYIKPPYNLNHHPICLVGPKYALLDFEPRNPRFYTEPEGLISVCVYLGGGQTQFWNTLATLLDEVMEDYPILLFDLCLGATPVDVVSCLSSRKNVRIHSNLSSMEAILKSSTFFVGSGGVITWERFYHGVTGDIIALSEDQIRNAKELERAGLCNMVLAQDLRTTHISNWLDRASSNHEIERSKKQMELVDGRGLSRVSEILFKVTQ